MTYDRHLVWRLVKVNRDAMQEHAPDGQEAVVQIHLLGWSAPIVVQHVETRRDFDFPWVFFAADNAGPEGLHFVREDQILRIEIIYRPLRGRNPLGFSHDVSDETSEA